MDEESAELKKFRKELSAGAVSLVLLALLDGATAPMYGYQIGRRLDELAEGVSLVKQGTLYPLLRSMESNGLLASEVEPSVTGPPRRYYTITGQGRKVLPQWRGAWEETRDFVDAILGEAPPAAAAQRRAATPPPPPPETPENLKNPETPETPENSATDQSPGPEAASTSPESAAGTTAARGGNDRD
jgi:PadR family transcriptional regulator, regulatory protein PadR